MNTVDEDQETPKSDEKRFALLQEQKVTQAWLNHPLATSFLDHIKGQEEAFIDLICERRVVDLGTFFTHFEAVGHLRGIRDLRRQLFERRDEIEEELKELE